MTADLVLVVDDSPQNILVATRHLEAAGYEVATAASGEQALAFLAERRPALIILDVMMPGIGGFEACRRIRATSETIPILFMTALGERDATAPALDAGGDDLLAKPFARSELLLRTRALIRQHSAGLARREDDRKRALEALERLRSRVGEPCMEIDLLAGLL
jgi:DNA-binding response OmpR family regulator